MKKNLIRKFGCLNNYNQQILEWHMFKVVQTIVVHYPNSTRSTSAKMICGSLIVWTTRIIVSTKLDPPVSKWHMANDYLNKWVKFG